MFPVCVSSGVAEINESIGTVFDDIERLATHCKFADCKHDAEPGCAVLRAIEENQLDGRRLSNYRKLLRENAQATQTLAEKRAQGRDFAKMVKEVTNMKKQKKGET